jgi:ribonuclease D
MESLPPKKTPLWVDTPAALLSMLQDLLAQDIIAVDTESNGLYAYREQVCLLQFSTRQIDYLVDPLALPDLSPLAPLFSSPQIEKIFHAAEYDLLCLKRDFTFTFTNLFDTMLAARILGRDSTGLGSMLENTFSISLDKRFQKADWGQRPLSWEMLAYARLDTHYLIPLRNRLKTDLEESGRWLLAVEDFLRISCVKPQTADDIDDTLWRIVGNQRINPNQIAVLRQLCVYRDQVARSVNRPLFKVISNETLLNVARDCPKENRALARACGLTPKQINMHGSHLLEAVRRGLNDSPLHRPALPARPDDCTQNRMDALRAWRKAEGERLRVESDVILPRDVMEAIVYANPGELEKLEKLMSTIPWRFDHFANKILDVITQQEAICK